ncbi:hypothetical protein Ndes2526A_g02341 [Nannochloris sp. 'desiccata']
MGSNILIPLLGPSASVELVEGDWVIPKLVERIQDLEEHLNRINQPEAHHTDNGTGSFFTDSISSALRVAGRTIDAGLAFIAIEDAARKDLTHKATAEASIIKVSKLNTLKSQIASLEDELRAAQEEAAAARHRATLAQTSLAQTQAAASATLQQRETQLQEEIDNLTTKVETANTAAMEAAQKISSLQNSLETATMDQLELATARIHLEETTKDALEWEQRCIQAEELAATSTQEAESMKAARSSVTHDLNSVRAQLGDVQLQAEDFQRRFLAERLERRRLHEELQTLRGNIRVVCRVRPCLSINSNNTERKPLAVSFPMEAAIRVAASERRVSEYEFSSVLEPHCSQQEVFEEVWPALRSCLDGHNTCIFAYGQTGSGKTHTIIGSEDDGGIAPRALRALFDVAFKEDSSCSLNNNKRKFSVSMLEIYMDSVRDLLLPTTGSSAFSNSLEVLGLGPLTPDHIAAGVERVPGRRWLPVFSADDALAALVQGCAARTIASTALNATSSRSHVIFTLKLQNESTTSCNTSCSMLHLVDLAGSERVARSEAEGLQLKEAQAINKSLSALGDVVAALQAGSPHVPYRNSKLTCLLQDSLGSSSKVLLTCCVAPELESAGETLSTLNFAQRAALVELGPSIADGFSSPCGRSVKSAQHSSPLREKLNKTSCSPAGKTTVTSPSSRASSTSASKIPSPARMGLKTPSPMMAQRPSSAAGNAIRASPLRPQK